MCFPGLRPWADLEWVGPIIPLVLGKILVLSEERRRAIIELLNREGRVLAPDPSKRFRTPSHHS